VLEAVYIAVVSAMLLTGAGVALLTALFTGGLEPAKGAGASAALLAMSLIAATALQVMPVKEVEVARPDGGVERKLEYGHNPWAAYLAIPVFISLVALAASLLLWLAGAAVAGARGGLVVAEEWLSGRGRG